MLSSSSGLTDSFIVVPSQQSALKRVLTVFFMGTLETSECAQPNYYFPNGKLIANLSERVLACAQDCLVYHGPGTTPNHDRLFTQQSFFTLRPIDAMTGISMDSNVRDVLTYINGSYTGAQTQTPSTALKQHRANQLDYANNSLGPVTHINAVGWSRGGVTTIKLANALLKNHSDIKVNIFAIDPVPGPGQFTGDATTLGANVESYTAFYAQHEHSKGFCPVVPERAPGNETTVIHTDSLPGSHTSMVGMATRLDGLEAFHTKVEDVPKVLLDHIEKFLISHGTELNNKACQNLSVEELLLLYRNIKDNLESYANIAGGLHHLSWVIYPLAALLGILRVNPTFKESVLGVNCDHDLLYAKQLATQLAHAHSQILLGKSTEIKFDSNFLASIDRLDEDTGTTRIFDSLDSVNEFIAQFTSASQDAERSNIPQMLTVFTENYTHILSEQEMSLLLDTRLSI